MASLRAPGLGPIVGHTTDTTCRIWIRAGDPADTSVLLDENRRTIGVIGMVTDPRRIGRAWYFRLPREFDRTGTFRLGEDVQLGWYADDFAAQGKVPPSPLPDNVVSPRLASDTEYTVRVGTLTVDDPMPNAEALPDWKLRDRLPDIDAIKEELLELDADQCEATFRTFPAAGAVAGKLSFLLGSCRYPGLLWKIKDADRIFGPMQRHFTAGNPFGDAARFTMMCGDQIYADMLNRAMPLLRADTYEEFQQRYLAAYGAPNLHRLLRRASTYMILDDHEIEDNWSQDRLSDAGKQHLFNVAIGAYQSYQWSHGPRTYGRLLYYAFECAGYPVFVLDTRTQRYKDDQPGLRDNHLLGRPSLDPVNHPGQLRRLLDWLTVQQDRAGNVPKFVVTSSVFVPNAIEERLDPAADGAVAAAPADAEAGLYQFNRARRENSDSWPAYPVTRLALLRHIVQGKIQNVVFLAGDVHCSNVAEIEFEGAGDLKALSVTSSAFYWPFPFADGDPNGYVHDSRADGQRDPFPVLQTSAVMHYRSFGYTQEDNFTRLDLDRVAATLTVRVFDRDGNLVTVTDRAATRVTANVLRLAAW
jgi:alkaline phosphatase D